MSEGSLHLWGRILQMGCASCRACDAMLVVGLGLQLVMLQNVAPHPQCGWEVPLVPFYSKHQIHRNTGLGDSECPGIRVF